VTLLQLLVWPIDEPLFAQESNYRKGCPLPDAIFASHIVNLLPTEFDDIDCESCKIEHKRRASLVC